MAFPSPSDLPWLDRMSVRIPSYAGYLDRAKRRETDALVRQAIADRLARLKLEIEMAIRNCQSHDNITTEANTLKRLENHVDRVYQRVHSTAASPVNFFETGDLSANAADQLHEFDLDLLLQSDHLLQRFERPSPDHNLLAHVESELNELEKKLDERVTLFTGSV